MVGVHHARDSVEAEAVELELFHVVPQVGEEEPKDLVRAVVEKATVGELV